MKVLTMIIIMCPGNILTKYNPHQTKVNKLGNVRLMKQLCHGISLLFSYLEKLL